MKYLIASDIHGSLLFCRELLKKFEEENAAKLILLGDLLYHGPRNDLPSEYSPGKVAAELNRYSDKAVCVRGNCDSEVDQMMLDFPIMADYGLLLLNNKTIMITHGHIYNSENKPPIASGDILLHGHTHIPANQDYGDFRYLNPGSVSIPKNGSYRSYMTYEDGVFEWKNLETGKAYDSFSVK